MAADPLHVQQLAPDRRQQRFVFTLRRFIRRLALRPCGSGNARRSSLPFGDSGNAATTTQADGTI